MPVLPHLLGPAPHAVTTYGLGKRYGKIAALDGVDMQVPEGAVYVLAGPNGAGKTTLMEILLNLIRPSAGKTEILGLDPQRQGPKARAQVGYVSARVDWGYGWMQVDSLLRHHAAFFPSWDDQYADRLTDLFALPLDQKLGTLSRGFARRVQLVLALAHRPPLLLLDEPTDGLDRVVRDELMGILAEHIAESPTTVLISTHQIQEVNLLADHVGILQDGRLTVQLSRSRMHRLLRRYRVKVPDGWTVPRQLSDAVIRRTGSGREVHLVMWGDEAEIKSQLTAAGAVLHAAEPLTLDDAVLVLLRPIGTLPIR